MHNCTVMLMKNLALPEWKLVPCDKPLAKSVICQVEKKRNELHAIIELEPSLMWCPKEFILNHSTCYKLKWCKLKNCFKQLSSGAFYIQDFIFLFNSVKESFPPIFVHHLKQTVIYSKFSDQYKFTFHDIQKDTDKGFIIVKVEKSSTVAGNNIFVCQGGIYISIQYVCDGMHDCPGNEALDEEGCECNKTSYYPSKCKYLLEPTGKSNCSDFYFKSQSGKCHFHSLPQNDCCKDNFSKTEMVKDTFKIFLNAKDINDSLDCQTFGQLTCRDTHGKCYKVSQICVYSLNEDYSLKPCENGDHLYNCIAYSCNTMFKCPNSYCVPWVYLCDGKWDCPHGLDESYEHSCGKSRLCSSLFKCKQTQVCLHFADVCDGNSECPFGDDEMLCFLHKVQCPEKCQCLVTAIKCYNKTVLADDFIGTLPFQVVLISSMEEKHVSVILNSLSKVFIIKVTYSKLKEVCYDLSGLEGMIHINVSTNSITALQKQCFHASSLKVIDLSNNDLFYIHELAFVYQKQLVFLNISNNLLSSITSDMFISFTKLGYLGIYNNPLLLTDKYTFKHFLLRVLDTDSITACCLSLEHTFCTAEKPWYFSCKNIFPSQGVEFTFYFVSTAILIGNIACLLIHGILSNQHFSQLKTFEWIIISINTLDLTCSIPLCVTWIKNLQFKNQFALKAAQWQSSLTCYFSFQITLTFNLMSPVFLCFLSVMRMVVTKYPLNFATRRTSLTLKCLTFCWAIAIILGTTIAVIMRLYYINIPMPLCSPFIDPTNSVFLIKIITWIVVTLQSVAMFAIVWSYLILVNELKKSEDKVKVSYTKTKSKKLLFLQIFLITSSNIICWIPSGIIYIFSMFLEEYPIAMMYWVTIVVTPVNSILNPIVFVFITLKQLFKK